MSRKPNIIMIMTDQQRYDSISANGSTRVHTPHLDALAESGVTFERAYANCPECVPARHEVISGRNALSTGVLSNSVGMLDPSSPTLMKVLRENGYHTQAIGKMHFKPTREHFGFHDMKLSEEGASASGGDEHMAYLKAKGYLDYIPEPNGTRSHMYYIPQVSQLPKEHHSTHWVADESIAYIDAKAKSREPFFLFTSFIQPHPPFDPPTPYQYAYLPNEMEPPVRGPYDNADNYNFWQIRQNLYKCSITDPYFIKTMRAYYHGCVKFVDDMVGRIADTLTRNGMREDTIIFFVSDHGDFLGDHGCFGKRSWFDGPARIPFIFSYPGTIAPGGRNSATIAGHTDIMPTLLALAGITSAAPTDGVDLSSVMNNNDCARGTSFGVLDFGERNGSLHAVIDGTWKYIYSTADGRETLLNVTDGSNECVHYEHDRAYDAIKTKLRGRLREHYRKLGVEPRYFSGDMLIDQHLPIVQEIKDRYLHPDNDSNQGRLFQLPAWFPPAKTMQDRITGKDNIF
ncbi:MAG: sulfatase-like hydrolase/transferase [Spirochaetes bacterium]|nr:sulfatase-like hydrolase/transferase [Spirochaetota bacterium]